MNLYQNIIDTFTTKKVNHELSQMPKWAKDEKLYNCDSSDEKKNEKSKKGLFDFH